MAEDSTTSKKSPVLLVWEDDANQVIRFDATISEDHAGEVDITDHPVESGADITDHIQNLPDSIVLDAVVTDDPLVVGRSTNATAASTGGDPNQRAISAYNWLSQAKDQGKLLAIFTKLRPYRNMAIQSLSVKRDAAESRIVRAIIVLREIHIAITEQVDAPKPIPAKVTRRRKSNKGKKTTKDEDEANKAKASNTFESLAVRIFG